MIKLTFSTIRLCRKLVPLLLLTFLQVLEGHSEIAVVPPIAKQAQLAKSFFTGEVLQPSHHLCRPPLDLLQQFHVFLVSRPRHSSPDGASEGRAEGDNTLPLPVESPGKKMEVATSLLLQPRILFASTLLAHFQLFFHQDPQVLLHVAAFKNFFSQSVLISEAVYFNFFRFSCACLSSMSRSLWMASLSFVVLAAPLSLISLAKLLRMHLISLSMSW